MKRIVNKENTTDTFWGGKLQYIWQEKKKTKQSNFLDLQRAQTNVIIANKFRSFKSAKKLGVCIQ